MITKPIQSINIQPISKLVGGLRLEGSVKAPTHDRPLISIITVVFNGEHFLEETIKSVIYQSYFNFEYIIIDGGSTDGTLEIILKYEHLLDYWVSERDQGIYDAMNKGIELATGDWINFMNAGDWFITDSVLFSFFQDKSYSCTQILYGNHEVRDPSGKRLIKKAGHEKNLWRGSQFCHQAVFVNAKYHKINKFNDETKIVADFEFFYWAYKNKAKFIKTDVVVVSYAAGGISDKRRVRSLIDRWGVVDKSLGTNLVYIKYLIVEILKLAIKKILQK